MQTCQALIADYRHKQNENERAKQNQTSNTISQLFSFLLSHIPENDSIDATTDQAVAKRNQIKNGTHVWLELAQIGERVEVPLFYQAITPASVELMLKVGNRVDDALVALEYGLASIDTPIPEYYFSLCVRHNNERAPQLFHSECNQIMMMMIKTSQTSHPPFAANYLRASRLLAN